MTTEANPESTTPELLAAITDAGYTRLSLGMQSDVDHVLAVLDRRHTPGAAARVVGEALDAGIGHVNLDLIYGTPTETDADLRRSLDAVLASGADHVSAYSLIVEEGTALARRVARGELPMPDDDVLADRYEIVDDTLGAAGFGWYEVSNWARSTDARCRHNQIYWGGGDWWGAGPGAHSHVGGTRWWNVRHPARYSAALAEGRSPAEARERVTPEEAHLEQVLLELRTVDGLAAEALDGPGRAAGEQAAREGLLASDAWAGGRAVLTRRGRLLADGVAISLAGARSRATPRNSTRPTRKLRKPKHPEVLLAAGRRREGPQRRSLLPSSQRGSARGAFVESPRQTTTRLPDPSLSAGFATRGGVSAPQGRAQVAEELAAGRRPEPVAQAGDVVLDGLGRQESRAPISR